MFAYAAYGLNIGCTIPLPELSTSAGLPDVLIRQEKVTGIPPESHGDGSFVRAETDEALLFWARVGAFRVRRGCEIGFDPSPCVEESTLRVFLLGPVLAVLLRYRGLLVLHASGVEISGGAAVFLGDTCAGKSTMAAAFHAHGHNVVSDDVAAIRAEPGSNTLLPGFPQLKLWPEVAAFFEGHIDALPCLSPWADKRARHLDDGFSNAPLRLKRIYVLDKGDSVEMESLSVGDGLMELIRHSYGAWSLRNVGASLHFRQCGSIAGSVPILRLKVPHSLAEIAYTVRAVEENFVHS